MNNIYYKKGYEYQLEKDFELVTGITPPEEGGNDFVWLDKNGYLTIKRGYAWDGPSGPAIHTTNFLRGSLVHDALYQLIRLGVLPMSQRYLADFLLKLLVKEDGMNSLRAWWVHKAVETFGEIYMRNKHDIILIAPEND